MLKLNLTKKSNSKKSNSNIKKLTKKNFGNKNFGNKYYNKYHKKNNNYAYELNIPISRWKFTKKFSKDIDTDSIPEKLYFIKKNIRYKTQIKQVTNKKYTALPQGLILLKNTGIYNKNLKYSLEYIFKNYKKFNIPASEQPSRGLTYLFTLPPGDNKIITKNLTINSKSTLQVLNKYCKPLFHTINNYISKVCNYYNINEELFINKSQIVLLKYEQNEGIWLHIDNIARYDQGPIITFSIGPEKIYYDLAPSIVSDNDIKKYNYKPFRVELTNDDILIMDGPSRMEWSHGLPYNANYKDIKYTIMLKCDKFLEKKIKHNAILDIDIYQSGLQKKNNM
jgi:hypothetical protein